jgi:4-aminobutyrate aminotransferase-like enzyme
VSKQPALRRGDLLPSLKTSLPGPLSRRLSQDLRRFEAPGINTLASARTSLLWQAARGANVLDVDGNRFLDLTSGFGVAAVGHRHPRVVAAIRAQAGRLVHGMGDVAAHPARVALARELCRLAPVADPRVYFAVSGSDAIEIALKTALLATGKPGIVAFEGGYHGLTLGALAATSRPSFRLPFAARVRPHVVHLPFGCSPRLVAEAAAATPSLGAVLVEPVLGREGVVYPPTGWLSELASVCRQESLLLIADEIFTGFGRTGHLFAVTAEEVRPDLLCVGKALGGGLPLAAVVGRREVLAAWGGYDEALHTGTFVGSPLACAAGLAVLEILRSERLVARAREAGTVVHEKLRQLPRAIRGRGLLWGIELPSAASAVRATRAARARGVLILSCGPRGNVLQVAPPLSITPRQLSYACQVLLDVAA